MRYIRLRAWLLFTLLVLGVVFLFRWAADKGGIYKNENPITNNAVLEDYPELYQHLYTRSVEKLRPFLSHPDDTVRTQAWRGLASTPVDSIGQYVSMAQEQHSTVAWFAISQHELNGRHLRALEKKWGSPKEQKADIARVLGQQGDRQSLDFLLSKLDADIAGEEHYALALSRLVIKYEVSPQQQVKIVQKAFDLESDQLARTYLYGWYRGAKTPLAPAAQDTLVSRWQLQGIGMNRQIDQLVNKLLPERTTFRITNFYNTDGRLDHEVPLSVELAKSLDGLAMNRENALAAKILLTHRNVHVRRITLQSLKGKLKPAGNLQKYITRAMVPDTSQSPGVWLQALETAAQGDSTIAEKYYERIERIANHNPYLLPQVLDVYETTLAPGEYLDKIEVMVAREDTASVMYAVESLHPFWNNLDEQQRNEEVIRRLRKLTFDALNMQDRGIAYMIRPLLEDEELFTTEDFARINRILSGFYLPDDIEVFQQFGELYKERFEQQARPVIDSLASLNYPPLNRSLAEAGWEVSVSEESSDFRMPDWDRLWELGADPRWVLRTEKGAITIEMDPLRAPATVSAIDSLSRAGAYKDIPFHRIVPNFVIQAGDIERGDGFGGPDFVLPTEASELGFTRGSAGIASAGIDTEGSQYFMMIQRAPHLNGNYTRFGKVVAGMDVVERIERGDKVLSTDWY